MAEIGGTNIEIAHHLNESKPQSEAHTSRMHEIVEIVEAILLAVVAITTAWSGYQAALWDSHQSQLYGQSSKLRVQAQGLEVTSNQQRQYNASTVDQWMTSMAHGDSNLAAMFERRLLPDIRPAFASWKKTDPLHNPNAPPGPAFMPEYHNSMADEAAKLNQDASDLFERGTLARERGDDYVRVTVTLATVLLLTAISQKFRSHKVRTVLVAVAFLLLCLPLWQILTLARA